MGINRGIRYKAEHSVAAFHLRLNEEEQGEAVANRCRLKLEFSHELPYVPAIRNLRSSLMRSGSLSAIRRNHGGKFVLNVKYNQAS